MPVNALNSSRLEKSSSKSVMPSRLSTTSTAFTNNAAQSEEERIAAMFHAGGEQWEKTQQEMANATPVFRNGVSKAKPQTSTVPAHAPPTGYICYRCGDKGHWIQECPTNDNPEYDNKPRVKRTTGIPRSFLKTIEKPAALTNDGLTDASNQPSGVMVNAEGDFVVAVADQASWEQFQAKNKSSAAAQEAAKTGSKDLQQRGLECPIDKRLFVDPSKTPCCSKTYCNECITNALIEGDLTCPGCQSDGILIDNLIPDKEVIAKIKAYHEEKESADAARTRTESPAENTGNLPPAETTPNVKSQPPSSVAKLSSPDSASMVKTNSKKRPADGELENDRIPKGPTAMRKQPQQPEQQQVAQSQQPQLGIFDPTNQAAMMGFPPNMPFPPMPGFPGDLFNPSMMGMSNGNNFMGMGMSMAPMMGMPNGMVNPMMMPNSAFGALNGGNFGGMMSFTPMPDATNYGGGYQQSMMSNGGGAYGNQAMGMGGQMQTNMNGGGGGQIGLGMNLGFNGQGYAGNVGQVEDDAYFRQPVNPHRHQARQRRMRPSDYQEL